jgi:hypothetical protein
MNNVFANSIKGIIISSVKMEKKNPFIIVNTDSNRGLYLKKFVQELKKYRNLVQAPDDVDLRDLDFGELIVFGDGQKYDYRVEMEYYLLNTLVGKNVKVFDLVDDYDSIVRRLQRYCENNNIRRIARQSEDVCKVKINITVTEEDAPKKKTSWCPFFQEKKDVKKKSVKYPKALVNVYEQEKPAEILEKVTVHSNWVKIGWNSYDIYLDRWNNEFISLEDGTKFFVKTDRFGKRYLRTTA